ncbi:MAG: hypothetical protein AB7D57_04390 [Desulfovibrionaceae bacterium]
MSAPSTIESAVLKLARQINAYDEASLMSLWERLADRVRRFEPTRAWEEAAIALSLVQGMRFKNQLFNYHWAQSRKAGEHPASFDLASLTAPEPPRADAPAPDEGPAAPARPEPKRGKLLKLGPREK